MTRRVSKALRFQHNDDDEFYLGLGCREERVREETRVYSDWSKALTVDLVFMWPELRGSDVMTLAEIIDESIRWNV